MTETTGFALAEDGRVWRTANGGKKWADVPLSARGLAAPVAGTAFALAGESDLLYTNTGGDRGAGTTLTLTAQPRTIGRKPRTVKITGKLAPAAAGATVVVSARREGTTTWTQVATPKVSSSGTFTSSLRVRATTDVVAQWYGDAAHEGDGSKALVIARKIPKKTRR